MVKGLEGVATLSLRGAESGGSEVLQAPVGLPWDALPAEGHAPSSRGIRPSEVPLLCLPWNKPDSGRRGLHSATTSPHEQLTELAMASRRVLGSLLCGMHLTVALPAASP